MGIRVRELANGIRGSAASWDMGVQSRSRAYWMAVLESRTGWPYG